MKYIVKVDGCSYEVLLENLHTQPIVAIVDGAPIEVWLESENEVKPYFARTNLDSRREMRPTQSVVGGQSSNPVPEPARSSSENVNCVHAPLPGVIYSVSVKSGDRVESGQVLCVIEAMKMKNTIRTPRAGTIAAVAVSPGQSIAHHDVLIEFEA